jgi:hypothetical protein
MSIKVRIGISGRTARCLLKVYRRDSEKLDEAGRETNVRK